MIVLKSYEDYDKVFTEVRGYPMDGKWAVSIDPYEKVRSNQQNKLFHKLCAIIGDETGTSKDYIKDKLKLAVFGIQERELDGKILRELVSTASLDVGQFNQLIDATYVLGKELNINLPVS